MIKKISYLLIIFTLFFGFNNFVNAEELNYTVDFTRKGSIDITLYEESGNSYISGAEITIYHIADIYDKNGNMAHKYTEQFSTCEVSLDDINKEGLHTDLEKCISSNSTGIAKLTDENGNVKFNDLSLGLYLVKQTNKVNGYSVVDTFIANIPVVLNNSWTYDIVAEPKTEIIRLMDVIVEKKWDIQNSKSTPESVIIELIKDNEVIDEITLNNENNWTYTWFQITESDEYSVREKVVPEGYTVSYRQEGNKFIVTNIRTLVDTGQNNIISIILGGLGIILIIVGVIYDTRKKYE